MRRTAIRAGIVGIMAGGALFTGGQALAQSGGDAFYAELNGSNELSESGARGAGDKDGVGTAAVVIRGRKVCYGITVANLDAPVAAHIHKGGAKKNGDVVVPLTAPANGVAGSRSGRGRAATGLASADAKKPSGLTGKLHPQKVAGGAG